jgi:hypothetical protein
MPNDSASSSPAEEEGDQSFDNADGDSEHFDIKFGSWDEKE